MQDIRNLCLVCKEFVLLVPKIARWLTVDFSPLHEPWYNYEQQERFDPHCNKMASAAMDHFGLDPGKLSDGWEASTLVIIATSRRL